MSENTFGLLKSRHDAVVIQIANEVIGRKKLGHKIKPSDMGRRVERKCGDFQLILDQRVWVEGDGQSPHSLLPDIIAVDHRRRSVELLEIAVPGEDLIQEREIQKKDKYLELVSTLKQQYGGFRVTIRTFVMGQLGLLSQEAVDNLLWFIRLTCRRPATIGGTNHSGRTLSVLLSKIQVVGLKESLNIYEWLRNGEEITTELRREPMCGGAVGNRKN
jgi:hypothetical protein